jgi:hypothetical protein
MTEQEWKDRVVALLNLMGEAKPCRDCNRPIWFVKTRAGKWNPIADEGVSHFADCPAAKEFRKR